MGVRRVIIVVVAAGLGLWVAIAAAQGGLGGASSGTGTFSGSGFPCPTQTVGSTTGTACPPREAHGGTGGSAGGGKGVGAGTVTSQGHPAHGGAAQSEGTEVHHGRRFVGKQLTFTFSVRLPHAPGTAAVLISGYSAHASPPRGSGGSCQPRLIRLVSISRKDQVARVRVRPPLGGWCGGRYHVTVSLNHGG